MNDVIDSLMAKPGLYVGVQTDPTGERGPSVARVEVTVLPGGSGVRMAYEVLAATGERNHDEIAIVARGPGGNVMLTAHSHAAVVSVLREVEPGYFTAGASELPFPMAIRLEIPEPGRLVYSWSYGWHDVQMQLRDVGQLTPVG